MSTIRVRIPPTPAINYSIEIKAGLLENPSHWFPKNLTLKNIIIITDHTVKKYYADKLTLALKKLSSLKKQQTHIFTLSFSSGEKSKHIHTKIMLEEKMLRAGCARDSLIIALGGGVVGDMAGFVASTYVRGIPFIQLPTTLLAMVDSSVGGKTGLDNKFGKNLIGAYWQPLAVMADINTLNTLPKKHTICGLVEALKMFLTHDAQSFVYLQKNINKLDDKVLKSIIHRAVKIKADVVSQDEKDSGHRMILNFGHTIGHALEKVSNYQLLHGYAVALGILVETKISQLLGILPEESYLIIQSLLAQWAINHTLLKKFKLQKIIDATLSDKKVQNAKVHYILLKDIGSVYQSKGKIVHQVSEEIVREALHYVRQ